MSLALNNWALVVFPIDYTGTVHYKMVSVHDNLKVNPKSVSKQKCIDDKEK